MGKDKHPSSPETRSPIHHVKMDEKKTRNVILDTICLVMAGEIISILASDHFSWPVTIITLVEVLVFGILAFLAPRNPYPSILSVLFLFIVFSTISAALKPTYLGGSIIIKIFILIYLVRSISEAREQQGNKRKRSKKQLSGLNQTSYEQ